MTQLFSLLLALTLLAPGPGGFHTAGAQSFWELDLGLEGAERVSATQSLAWSEGPLSLRMTIRPEARAPPTPKTGRAPRTTASPTSCSPTRRTRKSDSGECFSRTGTDVRFSSDGLDYTLSISGAGEKPLEPLSLPSLTRWMESAQRGRSWLPQTSEQWHISFRREGVEISLSLLPAPFDRNVNWEALLKDSRAEEREGTLYHLDTRALAPDGSRIARIFCSATQGSHPQRTLPRLGGVPGGRAGFPPCGTGPEYFQKLIIR